MHAAVSTVRGIEGSNLRRLAGLTWARVGWTCALAAWLALNSLPAVVLDTYYRFDVPITAYLKEFVISLPGSLVMWLVMMLLATIADNLPLRGMARVLAFALAIVLGMLALPFETCILLRWNNREVCAGFPSWPTFPDLIDVGGSFAFAVHATIIGIIWTSYRRDAAAAAALHEVALDRIRLQRRTLDAGLKARQARVEPEFLLDSVTDIAASCADDADRAERMIDELVVYLRAALPDDREASSTLGRELRMAEAFLKLMSLRTGERVRRAVEVPAQLHAIHISPALLLPLVACLVPHGSAIPADGIDVRIEATLVGDDLRIVIARRGKAEEAASSQLALTELRGRLRDLYGDAASLTVGTAAGDAQAVLVLPRTLEPVGEPSAMPEERVGAPDITFDPAYQGA